MRVYIPPNVAVSGLTIDADLNMGARKVIAAEVDTDTIAEKTGAHGIDVSHSITLAAAKTVTADAITTTTLKSDHVQERTGSHTVVFDNTIKASAAAPAAGAVLSAVDNWTKNTGRMVTNAAYTICSGRIQILVAGTYTAIYKMAHETGGSTAYGKIYKNGVAAGAEQSTMTTDYSYEPSENLVLAAGDYLDVYVKAAADGVLIKDFRLTTDTNIPGATGAQVTVR